MINRVDIRNWKETRSRGHHPALEFVSLIGSVFLATGIAGFPGFSNAPDTQAWFDKPFFGSFFAVGAVVLAFVVRWRYWPGQVRHAACAVLPDIPLEPVIPEGSRVHSRLKHELCESNGGWVLRPDESVWHCEKRFLVGFGVPFLTLVSGLLTGVFTCRKSSPAGLFQQRWQSVSRQSVGPHLSR